MVPSIIKGVINMNEIISAKNAPAAIGPYSHAVKAGDFLFTSGQIALVPETGKLVEGGIEAQAKQVFSNISAVLAAAGMDYSNVIKTTVFLTDLADFAAVNKLYGELFPSDPPARSCVQVAALPGGSKIEMEVIAHK
jgi:2-iminobutanoate/2-iminopropanoate deaminase